ncbi:MAG: hypothetical protein FJ117_11570 [Deltaproteobacteria bacterium]|nr:hypothetical protein [Deltaproteobacteria bacterium]
MFVNTILNIFRKYAERLLALKLIDIVRDVIRKKRYSIRTEQAYVDWIKRYILFHNKRHPKDMGEMEISQYLKDGVEMSQEELLARCLPRDPAGQGRGK